MSAPCTQSGWGPLLQSAGFESIAVSPVRAATSTTAEDVQRRLVATYGPDLLGTAARAQLEEALETGIAELVSDDGTVKLGMASSLVTARRGASFGHKAV